MAQLSIRQNLTTKLSLLKKKQLQILHIKVSSLVIFVLSQHQNKLAAYGTDGRLLTSEVSANFKVT